MRLTSTLLACLALTASLNAAVTIQVVSTAGSGTYQTPTGGALDSTYTFSWGVLDRTAFDALTTEQKADYSNVAPLLTATQNIEFGADGTIVKTGSGQSFDLPLAGNGQTTDRLYALVFNASLTEFGLFGSTNLQWQIPANNSQVTLSNVTLASAQGGEALVGSISGTNALLINNVPEPSTYAFLAGALALGVVAYRRRRVA